jgi:ferredoxin-thioredoxin reductase catalytic subunit
MTAEKQGWVVNPDEEFVDLLYEGFITNFNRYGYFSCPCRAASGVREKDADIVCPCAYARPDQADFGYCYCGLYLTPEFAETGEKPKPIDDRRNEEKYMQ